jgi:glyoxylate/hydroxypyruvate reductase
VSPADLERQDGGGFPNRRIWVESFIDHPKLPKAPLCKVEPPGGDPMMTEYVVMHVLRFHPDIPGYQAAQANREWRRKAIVRPEQSVSDSSAVA